jgi:hypothetical protein
MSLPVLLVATGARRLQGSPHEAEARVWLHARILVIAPDVIVMGDAREGAARAGALSDTGEAVNALAAPRGGACFAAFRIKEQPKVKVRGGEAYNLTNQRTGRQPRRQKTQGPMKPTSPRLVDRRATMKTYTLIDRNGIRVRVFGREVETEKRGAAEYLLSQFASEDRGWVLAERETDTAFRAVSK